MSKFLCVCGETIRISGWIPNPIEWLLVSASTRAALPETDLLDAFYDRATHAFVCPISAHMWIFWDGLFGPLTGYRQDSGDPSSAAAQEWDRTARDWFHPVAARCEGGRRPATTPEEAGELEQSWTISDVALDGLAQDVQQAELDLWLLPVRRCAAGDHLWVWWNGEERLPARYTAVGVRSDETEPEPSRSGGRPSGSRRFLRWLSGYR